jgi:O-antigen ligase
MFANVRLNRTTEGLIAVVFGLFLGAVALYLNTTNASNKIITIVLGGLAAGVVVLLVGNLRYLLLALIFMDLSTGLDLHLTCNEGYFVSSCGFNFSLTTLSLFGLYAHWIVTYRRDHSEYRFVRQPRFGLTGKAMAAFLGAGLLSLLNARSIGISLYQLWIFTTLFALFFYLANNITSRRDLLYILGLMIVGLFIQNLVMELGTLGFVDAGPNFQITHRVRGTFRSPNFAGGYLAQIFTILLACVALNIPRWQRWIIAGILLLTFYNLVGTESRGGWTSVAVGFIVVVGISLLKRWLNFRSLIAVSLVIVVFTIIFGGTIITRLTSDDNGAADARLPLAQIAFNMIKDNPVTGVGLNNFGVVLYDYIEPDQFGAWLNLVHNGWLLIWSETGTIGIVFYVTIWVTTLWQAFKLIQRGRRTYAVIALGIFASMLGTSVHMMAEIYGTRILLQIIWTEAALITAMSRLQKLEDRRRAASNASPPDSTTDPSTITLLPKREMI